MAKEKILGRVTVSEKKQFVLDTNQTIFLDELCLEIKRATGYKPDRSKVLRIILDLLKDKRSINKEVLAEHALRLKSTKRA